MITKSRFYHSPSTKEEMIANKKAEEVALMCRKIAITTGESERAVAEKHFDRGSVLDLIVAGLIGQDEFNKPKEI